MYKELLQRVEEIIGEQLFAVLSTTAPGGLHAVIVSFVASEDFSRLDCLADSMAKKVFEDGSKAE